MLVVTQDTTHARQVREFVESEGFFGGRYKGRMAEFHSRLTGEESDENAQRLLNIEKAGAEIQAALHYVTGRAAAIAGVFICLPKLLQVALRANEGLRRQVFWHVDRMLEAE